VPGCTFPSPPPQPAPEGGPRPSPAPIRSPVLDALAELHDARRRALIRERALVSSLHLAGSLASASVTSPGPAARMSPAAGPAPSPLLLASTPVSLSSAAPSPLLTAGPVLVASAGVAAPSAAVATLGPVSQPTPRDVSGASGDAAPPALGVGSGSGPSDRPFEAAPGRLESGGSGDGSAGAAAAGSGAVDGSTGSSLEGAGPSSPVGDFRLPPPSAPSTKDPSAAVASPVGVPWSTSGSGSRVLRQRSEGTFDDLGFSLTEEEKRCVRRCLRRRAR